MKLSPYLVILVALGFLGCEAKQAPAPKEAQTAGRMGPSMGVAPDDEPDESAEGESVALEFPNQSHPAEGVTAAGQPTLAQFEKLREAGYHTVVNLRTEAEDVPFDPSRKALQEKVVYKSIPISGPDDLTKESAEALDAAIRGAEGKGEVLVYCNSSNRVGAVFALRAAWVEGKSPEEALDIGRKAGLTRLEPAVKEKLGIDQ